MESSIKAKQNCKKSSNNTRGRKKISRGERERERERSRN